LGTDKDKAFGAADIGQADSSGDGEMFKEVRLHPEFLPKVTVDGDHGKGLRVHIRRR
jgi:hypothetical protein